MPRKSASIPNVNTPLNIDSVLSFFPPLSVPSAVPSMCVGNQPSQVSSSSYAFTQAGGLNPHPMTGNGHRFSEFLFLSYGRSQGWDIFTSRPLPIQNATYACGWAAPAVVEAVALNVRLGNVGYSMLEQLHKQKVLFVNIYLAIF